MTTSASAPDDDVAIERHSVRHNLAHLMTSQVITWTVATISSVIIPRYVGPATLGELRLANSLWLIVFTITTLGTAQYLQLEIARNQRLGLQLVGPTIALRTSAFIIASSLLAVYVALTASTSRFVVIVTLIGASTLLYLWSDVLSTAFVGLERMSAMALAGAIGKLLSSAAVVVVIIMGGGAIGIVTVGVVSGVGALAYMAWKYHQVARVSFAQWPATARRISRSSVTYMAAAVGLVFYQQIDVVVISWVAEREDLGWYGAADTLYGSLLFPSTVLIGTLFPTLGRLHSTDHPALERMVARTFALLSLVAVPIGLGTTLVAPYFAPLLYGESFREAGAVLAVLGPVIILTFGTILFGGTALATGRGRVWVAVLFAAAFLTVPLDMVLVPFANDRWGNGAIGGALAYVVTESMQFVVGIVVIAPFLLSRRVIWRSARILAAGGIMFAVGWPLRDRFLLIPIAVCVCVYVASILVLRVLGDEEKHMVGELAARLGMHTRWAG